MAVNSGDPGAPVASWGFWDTQTNGQADSIGAPFGGKMLPHHVSDSKMISMPTVLRIGSFRFHFYSDERQEPGHIHNR